MSSSAVPGRAIPAWLLTREEYDPRVDRDAFIDKSIGSFLGMLSRLRSQTGAEDRRIAVDARISLPAALLFVLFVSLSRAVLSVWGAGALLLALLSLCRGELILRVLKVGFPAAVFTFVVMLPSAMWDGPSALVTITSKVFISVVAVRLLVSTTEWRSITRALAFFFVPDIFILVLDITIRYMVILGEFSLNMMYALKLRSVGRNAGKAASLSGVAGTLFLKSRRMAEDTYAAMECRGFTGSYRAVRATKGGTR